MLLKELILWIFGLSLWSYAETASRNSLLFPGACQKDDSNFFTEGGGCVQDGSFVVWGNGPSEPMTYENAEKFCKKDHTDGGFDDWRLPTRLELLLLGKTEDFSSYVQFNPNAFYWSLAEADYSWQIFPSSNEPPRLEKKLKENGHVVCVRKPFGCRMESTEFKTVNGGCLDLESGYTWSNVQGPFLYTKVDGVCERLRQGFGKGKITTWEHPSKPILTKISGDRAKHLVGDLSGEFWSGDTDDFLPSSGPRVQNRGAVDLRSGRARDVIVHKYILSKDHYTNDSDHFYVLCAKSKRGRSD